MDSKEEGEEDIIFIVEYCVYSLYDVFHCLSIITVILSYCVKCGITDSMCATDIFRQTPLF